MSDLVTGAKLPSWCRWPVKIHRYSPDMPKWYASVHLLDHCIGFFDKAGKFLWMPC